MGKVLCPQCGCCFKAEFVAENVKETAVVQTDGVNKKENKHLIEWKESFSVGINELDEQHKKLMGIVNELYLTMNSSQRDPSFIKNLISSLSCYAKEHFVLEEKLMNESGFPGLEKHSLEHRYFIKMIQELVEDYKKSVVSLRNVHGFLNNWFLKHIIEKDKEFAYHYAKVNKNAA